jgi:hypothetical protein
MKDNECLLQEFNLDINDYGKASTCKDLLALAKLIQSLFLIEPGTYPSHSDLGIGIRSYEFEVLDDTTLREIKEKAIKQIGEYIPNNYVYDVRIQKLINEQTGAYTTLGVLINVAKVTDGVVNESDLILTFDQVGKRGKIVSKIYT